MTDLEGGSYLKIIENPKRTNGFSSHPNLHQLAVFILLCGNILTFIVVEAKEIKIIADNLPTFSVLLGLLLLGSMVSGYVATSIDTEDPIVIEQ